MKSGTMARGASDWNEAELVERISSATSYAMVVSDREGRIVWANDAFETVTGYTREEAVGQRPGDFLQGSGTSLETRRQIGDALRAGRPVQTRILNYRKDGAPYWTFIEITPLRDAANAISGFCSIQSPYLAEMDKSSDARELAAYQEALDRQAIVSVTDQRGRITFVNDNFSAISGFSREELIGQSHRIVNSGLHPSAFFQDMWTVIRSGAAWRGEIRNRAKDGGCYWVDTTVVPVVDENGAPERYVSIRYDITERKAAEEKLTRLARIDPLTQLSNRAAMLDDLSTRLASGDGAERRVGALMLFDLDHFKDINDTLGHRAGDQILCEIAHRLRTSVREADVVARLDGDEFGLILDDAPTQADCAARIQRLYDALTRPIMVADALVEPTFSAGVARFPVDATDPVTLLRKADVAMFAAKQNGRAQWSFYDDSVERRRELRQSLAARIREGVDRDEFAIVLQPQVVLAGNCHRGFEALARWRCDGAAVGPDRFIPCAEETGLIHRLGAQLMRKAFAAHQTLKAAGRAPGKMAVNVSVAQLRSDDFIMLLDAAMRESGIAPDDVEIEITETSFIGRSADKVRKTLLEARERGCAIALDDFGTGFSSLAHLHAFQPDIIKIDRSFVSDIESNESDARLVRATLALSREIGLETIAEGVESTLQAAFLHDYGCAIGQGYYFSKPLSVEDAIGYLAQRDAAGGRRTG